ncbi:hypothetical protein YC2023_108749 [Brassica napus]
MDMKHESSGVVKIQEENKWVWPRWVKTALGSCEIWSNQVKGEPLMERAADGGQTARLKCEDQLSLEESISLEKIEDVYENKINLRRMYEVRKMICELKQGKEGFNQHVKKLRCLWSEVQSLRPRSCDPRVLEEWREQDVVFSLLASLDSSYGWLVKLILKEEKLPNMEEVCVLVQRLHQVMEENKEITWSKEGAKRKKGRLRRRSKAQIRRGRCWKRSILSGYQGSYGTMKMGREEAQQILMGECSYSAYMGESVESSGVMRKLETKGADERVTKDEWDEFVKYVYALATTRRQGAPAKSSTSNKPIIVDSGASHHMISDRSLMSDVKKATGGVMIANGDRIPIEGVGKLKLFDKDSDAFYMPQFASNLVSVRKATIDLGCQVVFTPDDVEFQDLKTGRVIGRGDSKNNLYQLQLAKISKPFHSMCLSSTYEKIDSITWHARLGHPHARAIELIIPNMSFNHLECEACILGKHCRTVFPTSETTYEHCFDLVHSDVWTAPCLSRDSQKYFVTFIDEKSKYTWLTLLPSKDRVLEAFMNFQAYVSNQYNATVKVLRSDNGGEYISNAFKSHLAKHGIVHQTSCPYTPQQNGVAERKNRHLMEVARSMMFHANVPKRFWSDAVQTACYLINRVPTKILKNLSPFEVLNKSKPVIDHLRVFGCVCYVMVPGEQRNKLEAKSTKAMFIGYSITQKGYKCYDPEARRVMVSREVKFVETKGYYEEKEWENLKDLSQAPSDKATILRVLLEKLGIGLSQDQEPGRRESSNQTGGAGRTTPLDHERGNGTESGEQEQNQEDSGLHDQVENNVQSSGEVDEVQSSGEVDEVQSSGEEQVGPASSEDEQVEPASVQTEDQVQALRRSTRIKRDPSNWVNTRVYYNAQAVEHPSQAVCSFAEFPEEHYAFMISLDESYVPRTYEEAMLDKEWKESVGAEAGAMIKNDTWYESELPKGKKAVSSRWIFTIKYLANGQIDRKKTRLVARGFTQTYGEDYIDTFAPVAKLHTVRIVLSIATNLEWDLWQMDVKNAFLQGELEDEVYMLPPPGLEHLVKPGNVLRLKKAIYGLKQSPRAWYRKLSTTLNGRGFRKSELDHTLFTLVTSSGIIVILVYVDDLIITGSDKAGIKATKEFLKSVFDIKDLGEMKYFLGIEICRSKEGLFMCQRKYTMDMLKETDVLGGKVAKTPLEEGYKVLREGEVEENQLFEDAKLYRKMVGKLIYLTITRPDICFAVNQVSQHMQAPKVHHWKMVDRILRYLSGTAGQGVWMGCNGSTEVVGYCDADWAGDRVDRRSTTGYCTFIGGNLVTWKSKKQKVISCSSAEAEYRAMLKLTNELVWIKGILKHLEIEQSAPMTMHCDNQAAIHIASNSVFHERTKHIEVDCHKVRQMIILGVILPCYTRSEDQLADVFTK